MARSGPKGGRPRKWPEGTDLKQVHLNVPAEVAAEWKVAAQARGLHLVDWLTAVGLAAIGKPSPLPIQERLPLINS